MSIKKVLSYIGILAVLGSVVSCGPGGERKASEAKAALNFPLEYKSDKDPIQGGTYTMALVTSSPFKGIFSQLHSSDAYDSVILNLINEEIFWKNADFETEGVEGGIASYKIDAEKKQVVVKFKEGLKWSDGEPLGADDFIYTLEVLGHPDYAGVRYDSEDHGKIIGMTEYHEGKAKTISGLEKVSDTEVIMHLTEVSPKMITAGGSLASSSGLLPKHDLKDIPVKDLEQSDKVRLNPISNGPFVINKIVPGESVELVPNEYYHLGKPKVDKVVIKTLAPQLVVESMKQGEYYSYSFLPGDAYDKYKDLDNFTLIGRPALYYSYLAFNLGHYDKEKGKNVMDRETPLKDVKLRKALGYALNVDELAEAFYHGLRSRATQPTPPIFEKYYDETLEGYPYDLEKAKALLKEAGYEDTNGDGIVDKDGKNLELKVAMTSGGDIAEPLSQAVMQYWKEAGIDVKLATGRLLDFNLFFDKVEANDNEIDMFMAAWAVGTALDPSSTSSETALFNLPRYVDPKNEELLNAINDIKGLEDPSYKAKAYKEWQKYFVDQAVYIPLMNRYDVVPVNKGVKYANLFTDDARALYPVELVSDKPVKASN